MAYVQTSYAYALDSDAYDDVQEPCGVPYDVSGRPDDALQWCDDAWERDDVQPCGDDVQAYAGDEG